MSGVRVYPGTDGGLLHTTPKDYPTAVDWETDENGILYVTGANDIVLAEWTHGSWTRAEFIDDPNEPTE